MLRNLSNDVVAVCAGVLLYMGDANLPLTILGSWASAILWGIYMKPIISLVTQPQQISEKDLTSGN